MSLKSLAAIVLLLVTCIFGSVRYYLAADRSVHAAAPANKSECCNTAADCPSDLADLCDEDAAVEPALQTRRPSHRLPLALRRRDGTQVNSWMAPVAPEDATATAPRGS